MISRKECLDLLEKHSVPENVAKHVQAVEKVAVFLAEKMKKNGEKADAGLVRSGALLHDIGKIAALKQGAMENIVSRKILEKEGLKKEAIIAFRHMPSMILQENFRNWSLEEKIVFYADKRVKHNEIVGVKERMNDLMERYPQGREIFEKALPLVLELEKELLSKAKATENLEGLE